MIEFAEQIKLDVINADQDEFVVLSELDEFEQGYFVEESVDYRPDGPLSFQLVLDYGLLVHQLLQDFFPDFALLVEEGEELIPRDGLLYQGLTDAFLDIRGRTSLER